VLSELPDEWESKVSEWHQINKASKLRANGQFIPDRNDEYFLYQTLIGAWPFRKDEEGPFRERMRGYLVKAVREAKVHTVWV